MHGFGFLCMNLNELVSVFRFMVEKLREYRILGRDSRNFPTQRYTLTLPEVFAESTTFAARTPFPAALRLSLEKEGKVEEIA